MAIDRIHGRVFFLCDECSEHLDTDEKDFDVAKEVLKSEGWMNFYDNDDRIWKHICVECAP